MKYLSGRNASYILFGLAVIIVVWYLPQSCQEGKVSEVRWYTYGNSAYALLYSGSRGQFSVTLIRPDLPDKPLWRGSAEQGQIVLGVPGAPTLARISGGIHSTVDEVVLFDLDGNKTSQFEPDGMVLIQPAAPGRFLAGRRFSTASRQPLLEGIVLVDDTGHVRCEVDAAGVEWGTDRNVTRLLLIAGKDKPMRLYSLADGKLMHEFKQALGCLSPDGQVVAATDVEATGVSFYALDHQLGEVALDTKGPAAGIAFSDDARYAVVAAGAKAHLVSLNPWAVVATLAAPAGTSFSRLGLFVAPGPVVVAAAASQSVKPSWQVMAFDASGKTLWTNEIPAAGKDVTPSFGLTVTRDGRTVFAYANGALHQWPVSPGKPSPAPEATGDGGFPEPPE